jgi:hypothetical protein
VRFSIVAGDDEGGGLLVVEGAEAFVGAPGGLEAHESPDEVDDVDAVADLLDGLVGNPPQPLSPLV